MLRQPVCGEDTLAWWVPAGQAWSPALGVCWGARPKEPQKAVGDQSQQEGREEGVGLRKGFQEGRAEREEEAKESRLPFLQLL